jgi:hypothetical protein
MTATNDWAAQFASLKCACCNDTGFIAEEIDTDGWCLTCADNAEDCEGCGERNHADWLNGVASWGERRLCDECYDERPASRGYDPDSRTGADR